MAKHKHKLNQCPNCNTALGETFEYCPTCGQENHDIILPITHLGYEFIEGFTHFDTKILNTLKSMFTKPGEITKEYLEGKRAKYVPPPRYYIFISVIFFLLLGKVIDKSIGETIKKELRDDDEKIEVLHNARKYKLEYSDWIYWLKLSDRLGDSLLVVNKNPIPIDRDSLRNVVYQHLLQSLENSTEAKPKINYSLNNSKPIADVTFNNDSTEIEEKKKNQRKKLKDISELENVYKQGKIIDTVAVVKNDSSDLLSFSDAQIEEYKYYNDEEIDSVIISRGGDPNWILRNVYKRIDKYKNLEFENILVAAIKSLSICMFFLMPFVAFITFLLFRKGRKFYVEHLINSILLHSFYFTFYSIQFVLIIIWPTVFGNEYLLILIAIGSWFYLLKSLKVVFNNTWTKTVLKLLFINFIYSIVLFIILIAALLFGALTF